MCSADLFLNNFVEVVNGKFSMKLLLEDENSESLDARYPGFCYHMSHSRTLHYFELFCS
jgi:hypothetical protein